MTPWVGRLLFLNIAMFVLTLAMPGVGDVFMLIPMLLPVRPWTIVTYMFLHGSFGHIFFNMLALWFFGPRLEARLGSRRFLWLYLIAGITGGLLSFTSPMTPVIGASGATYGVMLGFAHFWPRQVVHIWGVLPVEIRWLVVFVTAISLVSGFGGSGDGIAHFAHMGGFLGAWVYLRVLERTTGARKFQERAALLPRRGLETAGNAIARWSRIRREELHEVNRDEFDRIMAKIEKDGVGQLTAGEREFLERFSQRAN
jgi:membrane associated rhomboid family serine protease